MPVATREQIESSHALPKYKIEILVSGVGYTQLLNARIVDISGSIDSTSNSDNAVAFGSPSEPSASIQAEDYTVDGRLLSDAYWIGTSVRISFGFDTSDFSTIFTGPINSINKTNESVSYSLGGSQNYLRDDIKLVTPLYYRKPIATATTVASIEDPTDLDYSAGMLNYAFWKSGGRPYEQKGITYTESSPGFKFWYSCDQAVIAPDYSWFSGENSIDEVYTLARAAGGQIYQDINGVLRYTQPLMFGETINYDNDFFVITDSVFTTYEESISSKETVGTLKLTYTPRRVQPVQVLLEDKTPRLFIPNETKLIELEPQLPVWEYIDYVSNDDTTATKNIQAMLLDGRAVTPDIGEVIKTAGKLSVTITNPSSTVPMVIFSIKVNGRPLSADDELFVSYGNESPERNVENNVYIQNEAHAQRLVRMIYDFYYETKPIITLSNMQFDTDRFVGELVQLDSIYNSSERVYRIVKIDYNVLGTSMNISLVNVTGLPKRSDMYIIGETYVNADVRKLSY